MTNVPVVTTVPNRLDSPEKPRRCESMFGVPPHER